MSPASFTFLTLTGTPDLSAPAAKLMRAHITKTNFAKRRQRVSEATAKRKPTHDLVSQENLERIVSNPRNATTKSIQAVATQPLLGTKGSHEYTEFFVTFRSLALFESQDVCTSDSEWAWYELHVSEPALLEAYMAVGVRFWSPDVPCQWRAMSHSNKALNLVGQRIVSREAYTDGIVAAVLTMAFGERLLDNEDAWNIHIEGLAQIIQARQSQGTWKLPWWLHGLLVIDSINYICNFPRVYNRKVVDALGDPIISKIASLADSLIDLRALIDTFYTGGSYVTSTDIDELSAQLRRDIKALDVHDDPSIQSALRSMELLLHLSWLSPNPIDPTAIASRLKDAWCQMQIRPCIYMGLTSCQLIVGAIAAHKRSKTRQWFVSTLKRAAQAMQTHGWDKPLDILGKGLMSDTYLVERRSELLQELGLGESKREIQRP